ncbi:MAG: beta-lactamase family protein [Acidobacteriota bacterium]|nr:beta-lactamase family protein [Acidobacteriota bacterium]
MNCFYKIVAILLIGMTGAATAQEVSSLAQVTELNRSGKWERAAQAAQSFLDAQPEKSLSEQCQARYSLIHAETKLGRTAQAGVNLAAYERKCQSAAVPEWLGREVAKLRAELAPRKPFQPARNDGFWQTGDPAAMRMNVSVLEKHRRLCEESGADACLVIRRGKIVQEFYSARYREPMMAMSSTKSVAGILVGMLIDDGKIKSIDEPVCAYISEWCAGAKGKVTLRHLLSMTSGLPRLFAEGVASTNDKNPFVIKQPLAAEPGIKWTYSNEGVQLLSPILDKAAGEPIQDYARKRLFEPLGMTETRFHLDEKKHAWTYADMETSARDFARLGLLMLNKGAWGKRRIVSAKWVKQSTEPSQNLNQGYGLLWWLYESPAGFGAQGYLDTDLYVFPEQELIVVRMQSKPIERQTSYRKAALPLFTQFVRK